MFRDNCRPGGIFPPRSACWTSAGKLTSLRRDWRFNRGLGSAAPNELCNTLSSFHDGRCREVAHELGNARIWRPYGRQLNGVVEREGCRNGEVTLENPPSPLRLVRLLWPMLTVFLL